MNTDLSPSLRARAFLVGYRQKEANRYKLLLGKLWQGGKAVVNWQGGSKGRLIAAATPNTPLPPKGLLTRPIPTNVMDYGFNIAPAAAGIGTAAYHVSEGEPIGSAAVSGIGAGLLASRRTWAGLKKPRGPIKTTFKGHGGVPGLGGSILGPTTTTLTPQVDNKAMRYLLKLGPAGAALSWPEMRKKLSDTQETITDTTSSFAESGASIANTVKTAIPDALNQPGVKKIVDDLGKSTASLADLSVKAGEVMAKLNEVVETGADFAVANPKKVLAIGGMYMLAAGGVTGLIVWLRERNKRRTLEEQDKRRARQQKKMMKMVMDAQEDAREEGK